MRGSAQVPFASTNRFSFWRSPVMTTGALVGSMNTIGRNASPPASRQQRQELHAPTARRRSRPCPSVPRPCRSGLTPQALHGNSGNMRWPPYRSPAVHLVGLLLIHQSPAVLVAAIFYAEVSGSANGMPADATRYFRSGERLREYPKKVRPVDAIYRYGKEELPPYLSGRMCHTINKLGHSVAARQFSARVDLAKVGDEGGGSGMTIKIPSVVRKFAVVRAFCWARPCTAACWPGSSPAF